MDHSTIEKLETAVNNNYKPQEGDQGQDETVKDGDGESAVAGQTLVQPTHDRDDDNHNDIDENSKDDGSVAPDSDDRQRRRWRRGHG